MFWLAWMLVGGALMSNPQAAGKADATSFDVRRFGAKCDWNGSSGTDDTAAFQAAATAAAKAYRTSATSQTVTFRGECVVNGKVAYGSGVHWLGQGTIIVPHQTGFTLHAVNADDVAWDQVNIKVIEPGTVGAGASAISWFSIDDPASQHSVAIRNCTIRNSDWGILVMYNNGAGSLSDVEIAGNTVTSNAMYTNADGIHVAGRVTGIRIHDNHIENRGDAGIGLTSEAPDTGFGGVYVLAGAKVWNNTLINDLVGLDDSGATNVEWTRNTVKATVAKRGAQNPAFRQIWYGNTYPVGVRTTHNYLASGSNGGVSAAVKIDPKVAGQHGWPHLDSIFENNTIDGPNAPFYVRGRKIVISGNTFVRGGTVTIDYDGAGSIATEDIVFGPNTWMAAGSLHAGAACSLYRNVRVAPQISRGKLIYKNRACLETTNETQ